MCQRDVAVLHLPVAVNANREKLGKQTFAPAIPSTHVVETLLQTLAFLNQPLPDGARDATAAELLAWAGTHWDRHALPARKQLTAPKVFQQAAPAGL